MVFYERRRVDLELVRSLKVSDGTTPSETTNARSFVSTKTLLLACAQNDDAAARCGADFLRALGVRLILWGCDVRARK